MLTRRLATTAGLLLTSLLSATALAEKPSAGRTVGTHAGGIASVDYSPDGKYLATGGGDKMIRIWDVAAGKMLHEMHGPTSFTCAVRFAPDGKTVAAAGYETGSGNAIYRFDVATGKELPKLPGHPTGGARRVAFSPDGKQLVSGGFDGHVRVWDLATQKEVRAFKVESGTVYGLSLSADGKLVATAGRDGLRLWDVATGNEQAREAMAKHSCVAVTFSPDGKLVASGDGERVKLWEVVTGKEVADLKGFKGELSQLLFSRDGRTLYTASYDRFIRLWDVRSGALKHEVEAHAGWVWGIALSPDESRLASCSVDTKVLLWEVAEFAPVQKGSMTKLSEKQLEDHWVRLSSPDAGEAFKAVCALAGDPDTSLPLLKKRLTETRPSGPSAADIARWIREMDSDVYQVREAATRELMSVGVRALQPLRNAMAGAPSLEVRKRAQRLISRLDPTELPAEELVALRGVQALEYIATPEARRVLEVLARREGGERVADEASQAIARLSQGSRRE